jgi:hypothetical protein
MASDTSATLTEKQQYWLSHIQQAKSANQSLSAYAQQHALDLKAMYNFHWLLRKRGLLESPEQPSQFIKVIPPVKTKTPVPVSVVTLLFPNGIRLEVPAADLPTLLQQVHSL